MNIESNIEQDIISLDVPLLIRLLEYAKEDAINDLALHIMAERLIDLSKDDRVLEISDYDYVVHDLGSRD